MSTSWIVMKAYVATVDVPGKERRRTEPLFLCATESAATALSQRLNRAGTIWNSLVTLSEERRGVDHEQQEGHAAAVLQAMDAAATYDARYWVEPTSTYSGPSDDVTPVFAAMLTAFAALPNPPSDPFEALYRLIRDAGS